MQEQDEQNEIATVQWSKLIENKCEGIRGFQKKKSNSTVHLHTLS